MARPRPWANAQGWCWLMERTAMVRSWVSSGGQRCGGPAGQEGCDVRPSQSRWSPGRGARGSKVGEEEMRGGSIEDWPGAHGRGVRRLHEGGD